MLIDEFAEASRSFAEVLEQLDAQMRIYATWWDSLTPWQQMRFLWRMKWIGWWLPKRERLILFSRRMRAAYLRDMRTLMALYSVVTEVSR